MGTRALVHFKGSEHDSNEIVATVYVQSDGYPSHLGKQLKTVFKNAVMRNGLSYKGHEVNGPGCAAALFIAHCKKGPGGVYVYRPGVSDVGEDYIYTIGGEIDGPISIKVEFGDEVLFDGLINQYDPEAVKTMKVQQ